MLIFIFVFILRVLANSSTGLSTWLELFAAILNVMLQIIWGHKLLIVIFLAFLYLFFRYKNNIYFYIIMFGLFLIIFIADNSWNDLRLIDIIYLIALEYILIHLSRFATSLIHNLPDEIPKELNECRINARNCYVNGSGFDVWCTILLRILNCAKSLIAYQSRHSIVKKFKEPIILSLYSINGFFILASLLAQLLGQDLDNIIILLSIIIYIFTVLNYLTNYKNTSLLPIVIAFVGGFMPSILAFGLQKEDYMVFSIILYLYFSILFIFVVYTNMRNYYSYIKDSEYKKINQISKWRNASMEKIRSIYVFSIILVIFGHIIVPMSLSFELAATEPYVDLSNTSFNDLDNFIINKINASYNSHYSLFANPTIFLSADCDHGLKATFEPPLLLPGKSSRIRISASDTLIDHAEREFAQIKVRGNFILFNFINCSEKIETTLRLKLPNIIILECNKKSPQIPGTSVKWTAKVNCKSNRSLNYTFYKYKNNENIKLNSPVQEGSNDTWTWDVKPSEEGKYTILVSVTDDHDSSWTRNRTSEFEIVTCLPPIVKLLDGYNEIIEYRANVDYDKNCSRNILYRYSISMDNISWNNGTWNEKTTWNIGDSPIVLSLGRTYFIKVEIKDDLYNPETKEWNGCNDTDSFYYGPLSDESPEEPHVDSVDQSHVDSEDQSHVDSEDQSHVDSVDQSHVDSVDQSHADSVDQSHAGSEDHSPKAETRITKRAKIITSDIMAKFS
jgi:hypothetical protein